MDIQIIRQAANGLKDDLIGFSKELIQTPSMSGQEKAIAKLTVAFGAGQFHINGSAKANELLSGSFVGGGTVVDLELHMRSGI